MKIHATLAAAAALAALPGHAVVVAPDGLGQVLIYPYYSARIEGSDTLNTYLSIANLGSDDKVLRVRFREARLGREVAAFNLYLGRRDSWTAVIFPQGDSVRLTTADASCTDPPFGPQANGGAAATGLTFTTPPMVVGDQVPSTIRDGYIEVFEMGTMANPWPPITHSAAGIPANCPAAIATTSGFLRPTGGLTGGFTVINVANAQEFTGVPDALADVSSRAYVRPPGDASVSFEAPEIDRVSVVPANGFVYRSEWLDGLAAVSAALMRLPTAEFSLDSTIRAGTDYVITLPTRQALRARPAGQQAPFVPNASTPGAEEYDIETFDRTRSVAHVQGNSGFLGYIAPGFRASTTVLTQTNATTVVPRRPLRASFFDQNVVTRGGIDAGWMRLTAPGVMTSLSTSTRIDPVTGASSPGAHTYRGLPIVGFTAREFTNGFLQCGTSICRGNYSSVTPFRYDREVSP